MTREEAIRDIEDCVIPYVGGISLRMAVEALKEQRPHGEWIESNSGLPTNYHYCSNCKEVIRILNHQNFCPNCGADMRKEGDRNDNF